MEEDVEGIDSLGPDLTGEHRRSGNGLPRWPASRVGEREEMGRVGKKKKLFSFFPRPCNLSRTKPSHRKYRSKGRYFRPCGNFQPGKFPPGRKYRCLGRYFRPLGIFSQEIPLKIPRVRKYRSRHR